VIVSSHLLGEIERVCAHVVVLERGRLVRSAELGAFTGDTGVLSVEVDEGAAELLARLKGEGLDASPDGRGGLLVALRGDGGAVYDQVRDAAADLGLPLVRLQSQRRRLQEVFRSAAAGAQAGEAP